MLKLSPANLKSVSETAASAKAERSNFVPSATSIDEEKNETNSAKPSLWGALSAMMTFLAGSGRREVLPHPNHPNPSMNSSQGAKILNTHNERRANPTREEDDEEQEVEAVLKRSQWKLAACAEPSCGE